MADWKQEAIRLFRELAPLAGFDPDKPSIEMLEDGINIDDWSIDQSITKSKSRSIGGEIEKVEYLVTRWETTIGGESTFDPPEVSEVEKWTVPTIGQAVVAILTNMRKLDWEGTVEAFWLGTAETEHEYH